MGDTRDEETWVAIELTRQGEKLVEDGSIESEIRRLLDVPSSWPVFIPSRAYTKRGKRVTVHLMVGYVFVATGLDEVRYFRLENEKTVQAVLSSRGPKGIRRLETIRNREVERLRKQLTKEVASDLAPGMKVQVTDGVYAKLYGEVLDIEGDHGIIHFELRSLEVISKVPLVFLDSA